MLPGGEFWGLQERQEVCNWLRGSPGDSERKNQPAMQETRFDPWVGKIPWRQDWLPTPVFLPGASHGQRRLAGCSPAKIRLDWKTNTFTLPFRGKEQVLCPSAPISTPTFPLTNSFKNEGRKEECQERRQSRDRDGYLKGAQHPTSQAGAVMVPIWVDMDHREFQKNHCVSEGYEYLSYSTKGERGLVLKGPWKEGLLDGDNMQPGPSLALGNLGNGSWPHIRRKSWSHQLIKTPCHCILSGVCFRII